jgi:ABC-type uncharacterized transport system substrate-binding protein
MNEAVSCDTFYGHHQLCASKDLYARDHQKRTWSLYPRFEKHAAKVGISLVDATYRNPEDFDNLFSRLKGKVDAVVLFPPSVQKNDLPLLIAARFKHQLPFLAQNRKDLEAGALGGRPSTTPIL